MTRVSFMVPGEPRGKGRPRFVRQTGIVYTPDRTVRYENLIRACAATAMYGREPLAGAVTVAITAHFPIPASWSKKKAARASIGIHKPTRIDLDQIVKAALDGMNGVVYKDDRQVWGLRAEKLFTSGGSSLEIIVDESSAA